jgi:hypothetical protein
MNKKDLVFILVEGYTDRIFFERVVKPLFEKKNKHIKLWEYAQKQPRKIKDFLRSIESMKADYIFVGDINRAICVTDSKEKIRGKRKIDEALLKGDKILIVIKMIESWYLAGLDSNSSKKVGIEHLENTDGVNKEQFLSIMPKKYLGSLDFMQECLKHFQIDAARQKNSSFRYFFEKYIL